MNENYNGKMIVVVKRRLLITYLMLLVLAIAIFGGLTYIYTRDNLRENIDLQVNVQQEKINNFFNSQEIKIQELARQTEKVVDQSSEEIKTILREYTSNNNQVIAYYVGYEEGIVYSGNDLILRSDYDVTKQEWYQLTLKEANEVCYTSPYIDTLTGELVITLAYQVKDALGKGVGVVGTDVYLTEIIESLNAASISMPHYNFLLDNKNNILTHENQDYLPNKDKMINYQDIPLKGYQHIYNQLIEEGKVITYQDDYDGQSKLFIVEQLGNEWHMGVVVSRKVILENIGIILGTIMGSILFIFLAIYIISIENIKRIVVPIKVLSADIEQIAKGNLTIVNQIKEKDELGKLADCINYMVGSTGKIIKGTQGLANDVSRGMKSIMHSSDSNNEAMTMITSLVSGIADDNVMQLEQYEKTNEQMQILVEDFKGLQTSAHTVTDNLSGTKALAKTGKQIICNLQESSESVYSAMSDTSHKVDIFYKKIEEVQKISDYMSHIAIQTQVLSLNATIEAARSGENGKGFEVIAKEMSALSLITKESNERIKEVLNQLSVDMNVIVKATNEVVDYIQKQYKVVEDTNEIFNAMDNQLEDSSNEAQCTFEIMQRAIKANQKVSEDMKKLDNILFQNNGRLQEITAMTEEQVSNSAEIGKQIEVIGTLCIEIQDQMKVFKIL